MAFVQKIKIKIIKKNNNIKKEKRKKKEGWVSGVRLLPLFLLLFLFPFV